MAVVYISVWNIIEFFKIQFVGFETSFLQCHNHITVIIQAFVPSEWCR